jgi:hypothetical protein
MADPEDKDFLELLDSLDIEDTSSYAESVLDDLLSRISQSSYRTRYASLVSGDLTSLKEALLQSLIPGVLQLFDGETASVERYGTES